MSPVDVEDTHPYPYECSSISALVSRQPVYQLQFALYHPDRLKDMFQEWIAGQDNLASAEIDDTCMAVVVNGNETRVTIYNRLQRCLGNRQRVESNVALESSPASNRSIHTP
jgi:hypothetical protein